MSRLSIRPRPLDIHKKLPIVKSFKDFEDDSNDTNPLSSACAANNNSSTATTRNSHLLRLNSYSLDHDSQELQQIPSKKSASEIPTPQFVVVDTYERDYSQTFGQPTSYLRARGARAELGDFVEYDLDNEDEDWLDEVNRDQKLLTPEKFETLMFKLEVLDHKARERAGLITPTLGSPIPVLLQLGVAIEALKDQTTIGYAVFQSVYKFWKDKRERWQKPILRRLQPPPPVNDTNPYNVFRPREKAHRLHTRRMQRRENNVQSFEKLRQVRRNLDQAKSILGALIKREEKKRDVMEGEVNLQRIQLKYKHEIELLEDLALPGFPSVACKFGSSDDEFMDSDDFANNCPHMQPITIQNQTFTESNLVPVSTASIKQEFRRRQVPHAWLHKLDPHEPVLLFTKPLVPEKLVAAGIAPPSDSSTRNGTLSPTYKFHGRIGRGGRMVFDRWNPLMHSPIDSGKPFYIPPKTRSSMYS